MAVFDKNIWGAFAWHTDIWILGVKSRYWKGISGYLDAISGYWGVM